MIFISRKKPRIIAIIIKDNKFEENARCISRLSADSHTQRRERSVTVPPKRGVCELSKRNGYEPFPTGADAQSACFSFPKQVL